MVGLLVDAVGAQGLRLSAVHRSLVHTCWCPMRQQRPAGEPRIDSASGKTFQGLSTLDDEDNAYGRRVPIQEQMQSHMLVLSRDRGSWRSRRCSRTPRHDSHGMCSRRSETASCRSRPRSTSFVADTARALTPAEVSATFSQCTCRCTQSRKGWPKEHAQRPARQLRCGRNTGLAAKCDARFSLSEWFSVDLHSR